jgi:hypothetical protein
MTTDHDPALKTRIDRSKTYPCRFSCGFQTTWPAARGRHEAARHNGHSPGAATPESTGARPRAQSAKKPRPLGAPARIERLLDELRQQQEEALQALKKTSLLVLADRDLRARETEQIKADLNAIYEVLNRSRQARQERLNALVR